MNTIICKLFKILILNYDISNSYIKFYKYELVASWWLGFVLMFLYKIG